MRTIMCMLVVVGVVAGQSAPGPASPAGAAASAAAGAGAAASPGAAVSNAATAGASPAPPINPYGPSFYGPGLNNIEATAPIPIQIAVARQLVQGDPNLRVLVDQDGILQFTNQFGQIREDLEDLIVPTPQQQHARELREQQQERLLEIQERQREILFQNNAVNNRGTEELLLKFHRNNPQFFANILRQGGLGGAAPAA